MKKIAISMLLAFLSMPISCVFLICFMGYENFLIMQQKNLLTMEMVNKQAEIYDAYKFYILLSFLPVIVSFINVGYSFYKEFTDKSFFR